jgi:hypothetical protein
MQRPQIHNPSNQESHALYLPVHSRIPRTNTEHCSKTILQCHIPEETNFHLFYPSGYNLITTSRSTFYPEDGESRFLQTAGIVYIKPHVLTSKKTVIKVTRHQENGKSHNILLYYTSDLNGNFYIMCIMENVLKDIKTLTFHMKAHVPCKIQ